MKKLLSLLSVLTIIGTAVPTTIAANPYEKEEIKLEKSDINYKQTNNLESLNRNKRDFYSKEQIEFFNNNFFYKFNVNYDNYKSIHDDKNNFPVKDNVGEDDKVIVSDWTKYAKNREEFKQKFSEIKFINFKVEWYMWGETKNKKELKISTSKIYDKYEYDVLRSTETEIINESKQNIFGAIHHIKSWCYIYFDGNKIRFRNVAHMVDEKTTTSPWVKIKFDSIRLVGEIDVNPLFSLTVEKAKQFDLWASNKEKELKDKKEDPNYNKNNLLNEENSFKEEFKLWLLQIRHDYIQDLINISQNNEIISLKSEIDDIKSRLDKLEKPKTCLDNIFDAFKKHTLSDATGDAWKSIKENSDSPLKVILKKSGKAFATGLLTGVAKGSALSIISCVADSI